MRISDWSSDVCSSDLEDAMKFGRLNHIGVATPSIPAAVALYRDLLGAEKIGEAFDLPAQKVRVCFVDAPNSQIELPEPLGEDSPIATLLEKNPAGGQHHLCRSEEHTSELQVTNAHLVCRLLLEKNKKQSHDSSIQAIL